MLSLLHQRGPLIFGDMAAELAMDRSSLSANLAPLFRRRLVSTIAHKGDRRKRQLHKRHNQCTRQGRSL
ncbi:hypothetical protein [Paraburkholderia sp. CNPSo 3281]|uniref:hypothetical protein n=1 Tax=Paraburkholderia sp. CNPSo 3281 TaxID=2940933 RepID=UPI0020B66417|nr:hypothetical protein [Paraburkholderia sp. CNPSo 3281]MCP3717769.1 hypothetical protein [Paraburkholderia sp. CNPSo 3281]